MEGDTIIPQELLPIIQSGASRISDWVSVTNVEGTWTYFCGVQPVFSHPEKDKRSFRMFTSQLVCQGARKQIEFVKITIGTDTF